MGLHRLCFQSTHMNKIHTHAAESEGELITIAAPFYVTEPSGWTMKLMCKKLLTKANIATARTTLCCFQDAVMALMSRGAFS